MGCQNTKAVIISGSIERDADQNNSMISDAAQITDKCEPLPNLALTRGLPNHSFNSDSSEETAMQLAETDAILKGVVEEVSKLTFFPQPSSGISTATVSKKDASARILDVSKDKDLKTLLRLVCGATNNNSFGECAVISLNLHRAVCLTPDFQDALVSLTSSVDFLSQLDLSGNHAGPVAVRTLFQTLIDCDVVEELNLSDNQADSECTELLKRFLQSCTRLCRLNLSGNQLGKESLSRCLSEGMANNSTLVKLNISSCGATNLHGLFEGLTVALSHGISALEFLDISNNGASDGLLLGEDIAALLKNSSCKLNYLNVENTGLNPNGWNSVIDGVKLNKSLREFFAGGSSNQVKNVLKIPEILFSSKFLSVLDLKDLSIEEQLQQDSVIVIVDDSEPELSLMKLNLAHCNISDSLILAMSHAYRGKLPNITWLNLSNNVDLTVKGIVAFKDLTQTEDNCFLHSLFLSGIKLTTLKEIFTDCFAGVSIISLNKSRIALPELCKLYEYTKDMTELILDGIKIGQSNVLTSLCSSSANYQLSKLGLRGCGLVDTDLKPLFEAIVKKNAAVQGLLSLDLSVNRLCGALKNLALVMHSTSHSTVNLNFANNAIEDDGALAIAKHLATPGSKLKTLNISHNNLTKKGLLALMNTVCSSSTSSGLVSLDVSSQKHGLSDDALDDVCEALVAALGLDPERALQESVEPIPQLPANFSVNLTNLGGSAGPLARLMDSVAIKTDFSKVCDTSPSLNDYLLISSGLKSAGASTSSVSLESSMFTPDQWTSIVGTDAPAWLKISDERRRGIYVSHLPGSATLQRLEGILELEADCAVSESVFIKDPALLRQSGAAWVLFNDEQSVKQAVEWYARGEAHIFGTAFCISAIPASVAQYDVAVTEESEKEKQTREKERKRKEESDRAMLEASQQLAEERAAYREAHPAYQNGRIW